MKQYHYPKAILMASTLAVSMVLAQGYASAAATDPVAYATYQNQSVYGYRIDYPANFKAAAQTGQEMQQFTAPDGRTTLKIWGTSGHLAAIRKAYLEEKASITRKGGKIGYTTQQARWYVITWMQGTQVNYKKVFCGKNADHCFWFSFPEDQRKIYNGIIEHIENSFRPGKLELEPATVARNVSGEPFTILIKDAGKTVISSGSGDVDGNEIWLKYANGKEELIVKSKNDPKIENVIGGIHDVQLSPDRKKIYFLSCAWATSDAVHMVEIATKQEKYLCPGNSLQVVQSGANAGKLVVSQHRYSAPPNYGSTDHYYLIDETGKEIKDLGEDVKGY